MRSSEPLQRTVLLLAGLSFLLVALGPPSVLAQQTQRSTTETAEREERPPKRTKRAPETGTPAPASNHTPATTIENASGEIILQASEGGSLLAPGPDGAIPAEGPGTRMMWYPAKQAFRAGQVNGPQWDADSIGIYSVAFGQDTKASGSWSMAIGDETVASGIDALATGYRTTASGSEAVAMGENTTASGNESTTLGLGTSASAGQSVAMGFNTTASGIAAVAMGEDVLASGQGAVAMGFDTQATSPYAFTTGTLNTAGGENSAAIGFGSYTYNDHSFVAGRCNTTPDLFTVGNGSPNSAGNQCISISNALSLDGSGNLEIAGSLTENSDRRLKTAIEPLGPDALQKLSSIDPVRFQFKNEKVHPAGPQVGLIAQDVQEQFPELVEEGAEGYLSVSYTKFSAVLLKGLQEQHTKLEKKDQQIANLTAKLKTFERQQKKLNARLAAVEAQTEGSSVLAGWTGSGLLAALLALGLGLGIGLLWRGRVIVRKNDRNAQ
jgi:hypothetical protein